MPWSKSQNIMLQRAATAAGWNNEQRYMAMRYVGCRDARGKGRPSATGTSNTQDQFELLMALAYQHAAMNGAGHTVPSPRKGTWSEAADAVGSRVRRKVEDVWVEASQRIPDVFHSRGLDGFVVRMTKADPVEFTFGDMPRSLEDCDTGQLYRILEGIKGWVGREMLKRGLTPSTFKIPAHARRQVGGCA